MLFFIVTTSAIVVVTGYLYYNHVQKILVEQNINQLKAISKDKSARVTAILQNKIIELEILKRSPMIRSELYNYYADLSNGMSKIALYNTIIRSKEAIVGINRMIILNRQGQVVISSNPSKTIKNDFSDYTSVSALAKSQKLNIEYRYNEHEELVLCLASYIDSSFILLIENDINSIVSVTEDFTGLGNTGESAIFRINREQEITYLTPLRFYNKAFLKEPKKESMDSYYNRLNNGNVLYSEIKDYRGEEVLASVNNIGQTDWKLITKMDKTERLFYMERIRKMAIWASISIILVVSIIIYFVAYFFLKPINDLAEAAEEISQGDLTKRVQVESKNEIGQLGLSFNKMTNSLVDIQKDLQDKLSELNRSNNELDKFAHVVSHDIKTPLNSIEGLTNLLSLELEGKVGVYEMEVVLKIKEQVKKTKEMIRGILEYAELKASKGDTEHVDLNSVVESVRLAVDIPANIKFQIEDRLPIIQIEKVLIYQIFQNLISNAVKYNDKSDGLIKIYCEKKVGAYLFSVSDNGIGIDEAHQSKIFDAFNTAEVKKGYNSSGIGLAIVKNIIADKGGSIWVESKKQEGSIFYFTLPIQNQ